MARNASINWRRYAAKRTHPVLYTVVSLCKVISQENVHLDVTVVTPFLCPI